MRYAESDALLADAVITEAQLAPVDSLLAEAKMGWPLTATRVADHTGTPVAKVRLVLEALNNGGWFEPKESFVCPVDGCGFSTPRDAVEVARADGDELPCDGCDRDLTQHPNMTVEQVYFSCGQPQKPADA